MPRATLSAGTIDYEDTGGDGPVIVFSHGLLMDGSVWHPLLRELRAAGVPFRAILPTLPLGSHRRPMRPGADLSMGGIARLITELLERLDLRDVTLAVVDWGGPLTLVGEYDERIGRLAIVACEAFDNVPPGLPGRFAAAAGLVPGGVNAALQPLRWRPLRRAPFTFGWMSKRPVPDAVMDAWLAPALTQAGVRRDLRAYVRAAAQARRDLLKACELRLPGFDRPALVVWAPEDRLMPREHGARLAALLPQGRLVEIADSYTLIPLDQPAALARALGAFVSDQVPTASSGS